MAEHGNSGNQRIAARTRKERARNVHHIRVLTSVLVLFVVFVLGFTLRGCTPLLQTLGFPQSVTGVTSNDKELATQKKDTYNSLAMRVAEVEDILASDSLDTYDLAEATALALGSFTTSTDDSYVRYYSQERYESLLNTEGQGYAGVGVLFSEYDGQAYAVDLFEGAPAQTAGVREGDFVVAIDGDRSQSWSRSEVAAALSRKMGSTVLITWRRPESLQAEGGEEFTTNLACAEYTMSNVSYELNEETHVAYIKVQQFTQNAATYTTRAIADAEAAGAEAFVLDLRDNPGGYLSQAVDIASLFMSGGTVVEVRTKDGQSVKAASGKAATDKPLVVLVNRNTAAAAEVVAAALKESQRATLIGVTTLGKGSVQILHELSFGGAMRYTAAYYLTPQGHAIDKVGVTPDVTVENAESTADQPTTDTQKDFAMELAAAAVGR